MDRNYTKINPADAPWLTAPSARAVCDAIYAGGHQIFYVGGCVRNALLGAPVSDVDLATSATPQQIIALSEKAGLKSVPTGIDHGTITVVSDGVGYEVTTFRRDVETDGRRAVVAFSTDVGDDARRRDFTMNALYADADGAVFDPLGCIQDLRARRVRFIEDASQRIREDYLRTLRYFRFHAWYGDTSAGMDAEAIAAIAANLDGLETLSAERVGVEMSKLLLAPDPSTALAAMSRTGVLGTILPASDVRFVLLMIHSEGVLGCAPDWLGRLVALGGENVPDRLRLSRAEQRKYAIIHNATFEGSSLLETAYDHGTSIAIQAYLIRNAISETLPDPEFAAQLEHASQQVFPVKAQDLMPFYQGAALGARLAELKAAWIGSGFVLDKTDLLTIPEP
ncbi:CCA tRNA nucleotidyltransferase [Sulfitobacter sp. F26169L]|uniref:CCA tRNA nucleotidyltransferase n=1 Tax=Sulfitobacter sp. F26169L TaxID=2996015 RepID=UPI002260FB11|nr:CCA tRNA nucleotidyltransferase [Sulfitobacter sp. F26169L]MCX7565916.1 CCA tRNA nucleotidyltransferase [Sulfitobacter sp. F26169L]